MTDITIVTMYFSHLQINQSHKHQINRGIAFVQIKDSDTIQNRIRITMQKKS